MRQTQKFDRDIHYHHIILKLISLLNTNADDLARQIPNGLSIDISMLQSS